MATKKNFDFKLGADVRLKLSGESGVVIGRSHSLEAEPQYHVRYKAGDGRLTEAWWSGAALEAAVAA